MTSCSLEHDGIEYLPEIDKVGCECASLLAHSEIAHFGCFDLVEGLWHIGIEWGQETRLVLGSLLL